MPQHELYKLNDRFNSWTSGFHPDRAKVLQLGNGKLETHEYLMFDNSETILSNLITEVNLGLNFDNQLMFDKHIAQKTSKVNIIMGHNNARNNARIMLPCWKMFNNLQQGK